MAQYLLNIAHETRELLANLGMRSLQEARGRTDLLHLLDHPSIVGNLKLDAMFESAPDIPIDNPVYLEREYALDEKIMDEVRTVFFNRGEASVAVSGPEFAEGALHLGNRNKSVGGQLAIDLERELNYGAPGLLAPGVLTDEREPSLPGAGQRARPDDRICGPVVRRHSATTACTWNTPGHVTTA